MSTQSTVRYRSAIREDDVSCCHRHKLRRCSEVRGRDIFGVCVQHKEEDPDVDQRGNHCQDGIYLPRRH